jgi:hypothetical protein
VPFSPPPNDALKEYAAQLYARRSEGVIVQPASAAMGNWAPDPNNCHLNVETWVLNNPEYGAVRGWLYFDFADALPFVRFVAHSVVRAPDGVMYDITPSNTTAQYPFITAEMSDQEFEEIVITLGLENGSGDLDHAK